jgi:cell division GTPase FtsZ
VKATLDKPKAAGARPAAFGLPGRIQTPNSRPRSIALVGLGEGGASIARAVAAERPAHLEVHVLAKSDAGGNTLAAIQAGGGDLQRDLTTADMIFIVARRGDDVGLAPVVSGIAHSRNHPVTALYIVPGGDGSADEEATLKTLRAAVEMLVVVSDESYVPAMIAALGS